MVGVWEHVHWLDCLDAVFLVEQSYVACLSGGIAAHVDNALGLGVKDNLHHILMHAGARRINDHHIGDAVLSHKLSREHIFHVAGKELGVVDAVDAGVELGILNSLGDILNAYHLTRLPRHEIGYRASAGVEVIDELVSSEPGEVAGNFIEFVGLLAVGLVERLGSHAEPQSFHLLLDVVATAIEHKLLVTKRIVDLEVDHIHERGNLRELLTQSTHHVVDGLAVVLAKDHHEHQLASAGGAHHYHAHKAHVVAYVVEGVATLLGVIAQEEADAVADVVLKPAFLNVEHLVKATRDVEPHGVAVGELYPTLHLLGGEPALVGEGELELVAVEGGFLRPQDGRNLGQRHLSDALQGVDHLLLLAAKLVVIGQMLPLAAATHAKVLAHGLHTQRAGLGELVNHPLAIAVLLARDLHPSNIAWRSIGDEHHQVVPAPQALALGCHSCYLKVLKQRQIFLLSHRSIK